VLDSGLRRLVEGLSIGLLAALTAICVLEVTLRNLAGASLGWGDEMAGYLLVWLTFIGATLAQLDSGHIGADLVSRFLSPAGRRRLERVSQGILLALQLFLLIGGVQLVSIALRDRATSLPISMGVLYAAVPLSALLLAITHLAALLRPASRDRAGSST